MGCWSHKSSTITAIFLDSRKPSILASSSHLFVNNYTLQAVPFLSFCGWGCRWCYTSCFSSLQNFDFYLLILALNILFLVHFSQFSQPSSLLGHVGWPQCVWQPSRQVGHQAKRGNPEMPGFLSHSFPEQKLSTWILLRFLLTEIFTYQKGKNFMTENCPIFKECKIFLVAMSR